MGEPKAITYKEVKKAVGDEGSLEAWWKIGEIAGAGKTSTGIDGDGSIDLTEVSDAKRARIDALLAKEDDAQIISQTESVAKTASKKEGAK